MVGDGHGADELWRDIARVDGAEPDPADAGNAGAATSMSAGRATSKSRPCSKVYACEHQLL